MSAVTNASGKNRVAPKIATNGAGAVSIDDDVSKTPNMIVAFTNQAMIVANLGTTAGAATPSSTIV